MNEDCFVCKHYNVFWDDSGCNLLNNGEQCKFTPQAYKPINESEIL